MRNLELGESGEVSVTAQFKNSAGRWVAAPQPEGDPMEGSGLRARRWDPSRDRAIRPDEARS